MKVNFMGMKEAQRALTLQDVKSVVINFKEAFVLLAMEDTCKGSTSSSINALQRLQRKKPNNSYTGEDGPLQLSKIPINPYDSILSLLTIFASGKFNRH